MADEPPDRGEVSLTRLFPSARLLQGVGASLQFKKLYLAALGILLLDLGWGALNRTSHEAPRLAVQVELGGDPADRPGIEPYLRRALWRLTEPARVVIGPFLGVFSRQANAGNWFHALLGSVWAVAVWGIIGGAIARITTVQVAGGVRLGLRAALGFALRKWIPLVGGPLTPLFGVALFAAGCAGFGLLYRLPGPVGPTLAGVLFVLPLLAGLVMATILLGLAAGWPLVHAAVAAEAEDGFDALSRSYAYVFQRPGRYTLYVAIAWVVGVAGIVFIDGFSSAVVSLARWGLGFTAPADELARFFAAGTSSDASGALSIHGFWLSFIALLVRGWTYAYFWTSASIIYLLLRRAVDGTDFHQVARYPPSPSSRQSRPPVPSRPSRSPWRTSEPEAPALRPSDRGGLTDPGLPVVSIRGTRLQSSRAASRPSVRHPGTGRRRSPRNRPMSVDALAQTPLHAWHQAHGARLVEFGGWSMPVQYTSIVEEHQAVRRRVGLFDISHMGRLTFDGPAAEAWLEHATTNHVARLAVDQIQYSLMVNGGGGVIDDILVYRLANGFAVVCNASNRAAVVAQFERVRNRLDAGMVDRTLDTAMIAVQGPRALETLQPLFNAPLAGLKYYHLAMGRLLGRVDTVVSRTGYTGEDGFELLVPATEAAAVWDALIDAGASFGILPCGLGARDTLRFEAAMPLYGHELSETIDPYAAGVGWAIKLEKGEFLGREALRNFKAHPGQARVGLRLEGKRIARQGSLVRAGGKDVGIVTSGTFAPTLGQSLAMALVEPRLTAVGTPLVVDVRGRDEAAEVIALPFYKRPKTS